MYCSGYFQIARYNARSIPTARVCPKAVTKSGLGLEFPNLYRAIYRHWRLQAFQPGPSPEHFSPRSTTQKSCNLFRLPSSLEGNATRRAGDPWNRPDAGY